MAFDLDLLTSLLLCIVTLVIFLFFFFNFKTTLTKIDHSESSHIPKSYPIIGSFFSFLENKDRLTQWISDVVHSTPNLTFTLHLPLGHPRILTANPSNVQHILRTRFDIYQKGDIFRTPMSDFLGNGIFNVDGDMWKHQRKVASHEFTTKSLRKFIESVVEAEISERLIPILSTAAVNKTILDFQDILQRFGFDNICKISFGYDPAYLLPSLPHKEFAVAFDQAVQLSCGRFTAALPLIWKIKRAMNIGSEKKLRTVVGQIRQFAQKLVREKQRELSETSSLDSMDLLSRFLITGQSDEAFVTDIVISFILAGRDSTSAALTWFFWLIYKHPEVENKILKEIREKSEDPVYDEVKDMVYTHASLCESMRFYPPVPMDAKEAIEDDTLPDGTFVKKGSRLVYHPYAMGRVEKIWGKDWAQFRPERWLDKDEVSGKWTFVARDPFTYPVFQAGPRICLGKEMAFLQMKRVVAGVLRRFKVVSVIEQGVEPVFTANLTSKMKGGFPVMIKERNIDS